MGDTGFNACTIGKEDKACSKYLLRFNFSRSSFIVMTEMQVVNLGDGLGQVRSKFPLTQRAEIKSNALHTWDQLTRATGSNTFSDGIRNL